MLHHIKTWVGTIIICASINIGNPRLLRCVTSKFQRLASQQHKRLQKRSTGQVRPLLHSASNTTAVPLPRGVKHMANTQAQVQCGSQMLLEALRFVARLILVCFLWLALPAHLQPAKARVHSLLPLSACVHLKLHARQDSKKQPKNRSVTITCPGSHASHITWLRLNVQKAGISAMRAISHFVGSFVPSQLDAAIASSLQLHVHVPGAAQSVLLLHCKKVLLSCNQYAGVQLHSVRLELLDNAAHAEGSHSLASMCMSALAYVCFSDAHPYGLSVRLCFLDTFKLLVPSVEAAARAAVLLKHLGEEVEQKAPIAEQQLRRRRHESSQVTSGKAIYDVSASTRVRHPRSHNEPVSRTTSQACAISLVSFDIDLDQMCIFLPCNTAVYSSGFKASASVSHAFKLSKITACMSHLSIQALNARTVLSFDVSLIAPSQETPAVIDTRGTCSMDISDLRVPTPEEVERLKQAHGALAASTVQLQRSHSESAIMSEGDKETQKASLHEESFIALPNVYMRSVDVNCLMLLPGDAVLQATVMSIDRTDHSLALSISVHASTKMDKKLGNNVTTIGHVELNVEGELPQRSKAACSASLMTEATSDNTASIRMYSRQKNTLNLMTLQPVIKAFNEAAEPFHSTFQCPRPRRDTSTAALVSFPCVAIPVWIELSVSFTDLEITLDSSRQLQLHELKFIAQGGQLEAHLTDMRLLCAGALAAEWKFIYAKADEQLSPETIAATASPPLIDCALALNSKEGSFLEALRSEWLALMDGSPELEKGCLKLPGACASFGTRSTMLQANIGAMQTNFNFQSAVFTMSNLCLSCSSKPVVQLSQGLTMCLKLAEPCPSLTLNLPRMDIAASIDLPDVLQSLQRELAENKEQRKALSTEPELTATDEPLFRGVSAVVLGLHISASYKGNCTWDETLDERALSIPDSDQRCREDAKSEFTSSGPSAGEAESSKTFIPHSGFAACTSIEYAECLACTPGPAMNASLCSTSISYGQQKFALEVARASARAMNVEQLQWEPLVDCFGMYSLVEEVKTSLNVAMDCEKPIEATLTPASMHCVQSTVSSLCSWENAPYLSWGVFNDTGTDVKVLDDAGNTTLLHDKQKVFIWPPSLPTTEAQLRFGEGAKLVFTAHSIRLQLAGSGAIGERILPFKLSPEPANWLDKAIVERSSSYGMFHIRSPLRIRNLSPASLRVTLCKPMQHADELLVPGEGGSERVPLEHVCATSILCVHSAYHSEQRLHQLPDSVAIYLDRGTYIVRQRVGSAHEEIVYYNAFNIRNCLPGVVRLNVLKKASKAALQSLWLPERSDGRMEVLHADHEPFVLDLTEKEQNVHTKINVYPNEMKHGTELTSSESSYVRILCRALSNTIPSFELLITPILLLKSDLKVPIGVQGIATEDQDVESGHKERSILPQSSLLMSSDKVSQLQLRIRYLLASAKWSNIVSIQSLQKKVHPSTVLVPQVGPLHIVHGEDWRTIYLQPVGWVHNKCSESILIVQEQALISHASGKHPASVQEHLQGALLLKPNEEAVLPVSNHQSANECLWRLYLRNRFNDVHASCPLSLLGSNTSVSSTGLARDDLVELGGGSHILRVCVQATKCVISHCDSLIGIGGPLCIRNRTSETLSIKQKGSLGSWYRCRAGQCMKIPWKQPHTPKRLLRIADSCKGQILAEFADDSLYHGLWMQCGFLCIRCDAEANPQNGGPSTIISVAKCYADLAAQMVEPIEGVGRRQLQLNVPWAGLSICVNNHEILYAYTCGIEAEIYQPNVQVLWVTGSFSLSRMHVDCFGSMSAYKVLFDAPSTTAADSNALSLQLSAGLGSSLPQEYVVSVGRVRCMMASSVLQLDGRVIRYLLCAFSSSSMLHLRSTSEGASYIHTGVQQNEVKGLCYLSDVYVQPPPQLYVATTSLLGEQSAFRSITGVDHANISLPILRLRGPLCGYKPQQLVLAAILRQLKSSTSLINGINAIANLAMGSKALSIPRALVQYSVSRDSVALQRAVSTGLAFTQMASEDVIHALNALGGGLNMPPPGVESSMSNIMAYSVLNSIHALLCGPVKASQQYGALIGAPLGLMSSIAGIILRPTASMCSAFCRTGLRLMTTLQGYSLEEENCSQQKKIALRNHVRHPRLATSPLKPLSYAQALFVQGGEPLTASFDGYFSTWGAKNGPLMMSSTGDLVVGAMLKQQQRRNETLWAAPANSVISAWQPADERNAVTFAHLASDRRAGLAQIQLHTVELQKEGVSHELINRIRSCADVVSSSWRKRDMSVFSHS